MIWGETQKGENFWECAILGSKRGGVRDKVGEGGVGGDEKVSSRYEEKQDNGEEKGLDWESWNSSCAWQTRRLHWVAEQGKVDKMKDCWIEMMKNLNRSSKEWSSPSSEGSHGFLVRSSSCQYQQLIVHLLKMSYSCHLPATKVNVLSVFSALDTSGSFAGIW